MIQDVIAAVPASLASFGRRIADQTSHDAAQPLSSLGSRTTFDTILEAFGRRFESVDRRALVSFWSQYYLPALLIPYFTALSRLGRVLPISFDEVGFELDEHGTIARFVLNDAEVRRTGQNAGLTPLIDGHLRPFFDLCHAHSGLSRRVLWGNAGVTADHVLRELSMGPNHDPDRSMQAQACLGWRSGEAFLRCPLAEAFKTDGKPCRRVCCMRYRLPGVASCGALCPMTHLTKAPC